MAAREAAPEEVADEIALLDWKRRVFELYAAVRRFPEPAVGWRAWRATRDELFKSHSQSPLSRPQRATFERCSYFPYDPAARFLADVRPAQHAVVELTTSQEERIRFVRFAEAVFQVAGNEHALSLYWLEGYGGGAFLPFGDETNGPTTYGGGRYLLDTVKGADLGMERDKLVLDFNFAYNPSCAYDPRWVCPLSPVENRLPLAIEAGELTTV